MNDETLDGYLDLLAAGERSGAVELATSLVRQGTDVDDVVAGLVCAAQVEVGRRWERNEWSVAQEHAATSVSEAVLSALTAEVETGDDDRSGGGRLVAVCVEGEWHTLALHVITGLVRRSGWDVTFLGPSVPAAQLARYLHDVGPDGLLVSCSISLNLPGARRVIEASRATGTPVLAGGRGFGADERRARFLGANAWAADGSAAVDALRDWKRFTTPAPPLTHRGYAEHQAIERRTDDLVHAAFEALAGAFPPVGQYSGEQLDRTLEDLRFLLGFLSAALLVDEPGVLDEYVAWLAVVLGSRDLPESVVPVTLEAVATATGESLPIATGMLRSCAG